MGNHERGCPFRLFRVPTLLLNRSTESFAGRPLWLLCVSPLIFVNPDASVLLKRLIPNIHPDRRVSICKHHQVCASLQAELAHTWWNGRMRYLPDTMIRKMTIYYCNSARASFALNQTKRYQKSSKFKALDDRSVDFRLFQARAVDKCNTQQGGATKCGQWYRST